MVLETEFRDGYMQLAQYDHVGESGDIFVFHSNSCHPYMANDGFSDTAVMVRLFQWLVGRNTHFTYRLVVGPEHLGTVFYLRDHSDEEVSRYRGGCFGEMMGTPGPFKVAETFWGNTYLDHIFRHIGKKYGVNPEFVAFRKGVGNDETVWEAPGYEVPFIQVSRANLGVPFPEYHSSDDNPDLMSHDLLNECFELFKRVINVLETNVTCKRKFSGLIALLIPSTICIVCELILQ